MEKKKKRAVRSGTDWPKSVSTARIYPGKREMAARNAATLSRTTSGDRSVEFDSDQINGIGLAESGDVQHVTGGFAEFLRENV